MSDSISIIENELSELSGNTTDRINNETSNIRNYIDSEITELTDSVNDNNQLINNRINNIISNSAQTEGNSELIDIRTGADNTVYNTAGDAVRAQFTRTNDIILKHTGHANLFDKRKFTPECEFKASTRTVIPNDRGYGLSDFISVQPGRTLYFSRSGVSGNTTYIIQLIIDIQKQCRMN